MSYESNPDFFQYTVRGIVAAFEAEVREPREIIKRAEERRDALIAEARKWAEAREWANRMVATSNGSLAVPEGNGTTPPADEVPRANGTNGHSGERLPSKEVVQKYVDEVMADPSVQIVTQTEVKDRILSQYPISDKKLMNSLRVMIIAPLNELEEQRQLELIEKANAGKPNKYRKTGEKTEESGELVLRSGP